MVRTKRLGSSLMKLLSFFLKNVNENLVTFDEEDETKLVESLFVVAKHVQTRTGVSNRHLRTANHQSISPAFYYQLFHQLPCAKNVQTLLKAVRMILMTLTQGVNFTIML
jgi:hypothetical protein